ncbi:MAG: sugar transferase [Patescibacteria group bacterium]|jgi:exopolysaccharide biosynthesis polyprenyl glycosylphosphotransferase
MKKSELFLTFLLLPLDISAIVAGGLTAYALRFHPALAEIKPVIFQLPLDRYAGILALAVVLWIVVFAFAGLYNTHPRPLKKELVRLFIASAASMAVIFSVLFFSRSFFESRFIVMAGWALALAFTGLERVAIRLLQRALLVWGIGIHRVVVIGKNKTAEALIKEFKHKGRLGFRVIAHLAKYDESTQKVLADLVKKDAVDEILLTDQNVSREDTLELLAFTDAEHISFKYTADLFAAAIGRTDIGTYAGIPVVEIRKTPLDGWGAIYKRFFDIAVSLTLIVITLPIQIITVIALFIEQPGRVLFSRLPDGKKTVRVGQHGKNFHYFKFRSMIKDAHKYRFDPDFIKKYGNEREGTPLFKLKDDPRITPVGRFIRKFSIDELPEFYLVFFGRMSLIGPRPHLPEEVAEYKPHHRRVLTIKPGITGLAQISGRADLDFEDEVRLDTYYIEHWSPWLDLTILLRTPFVVLFGHEGG